MRLAGLQGMTLNLEAADRRPAIEAGHAARWASAVVSRIRHGLCAVRGHDLVMHFERRRLSLLCSKCGWNSTGWTIHGPTGHGGR
jgi:hypothetical protein